MFSKLKTIKEKYLSLQEEMTKNKQKLNDIKFLKKINKLEKIVFLYDEYLTLEKEYQNIKKIIENTNIKTKENDFFLLAKETEQDLKLKIEEQTEKLKKILFSENEDDDKNVIMEIKGAAGGNESNLFVADLFRAYNKYVENQKWKIDIINLVPGYKNGISSVEMIIYGSNVYSFLKYESGIHRVQRVPETENKGRIHTSTVKVLVTPDIEEEQNIELNWNDIRVDTFNSSGPGGQSVNTTKSAVRLTYLPTGDSVACQIAKSQHQNKEKAFQLLKNKIFNTIESEKQKKQNEVKKNFIGSGNRSEKIRTYNYAQNRITDHRINLSLQKLDFFMEGKINLIVEPLIQESQKQRLKEEIK
ncbi:peptide chain release factor 1 ['Camptotheca acuminata' phytoplasma]|uniref:peptide chain release factor 1 n=1 Tax='Camptotheca acuminata' phytoplasma TaxID=3239192 RepID=UPI003519E5FE